MVCILPGQIVLHFTAFAKRRACVALLGCYDERLTAHFAYRSPGNEIMSDSDAERIQHIRKGDANALAEYI